jgi:aminotransferase
MRDQLAFHLFDNNIYTTLRYHPLHLNQLYKQVDAKLINSEQLNKEALSLPLHPRLIDSEIEKIISKVRKFYKN